MSKKKEDWRERIILE
jgi:hypothetical protein